MAGVTAREHAEALDAADPLAGFRARFEHAGDGIYLDGNSLGRLPAATRERVLAVVDQWSREAEDRWEYDDFSKNPAWRKGWISFDCALYHPPTTASTSACAASTPCRSSKRTIAAAGASSTSATEK